MQRTFQRISQNDVSYVAAPWAALGQVYWVVGEEHAFACMRQADFERFRRARFPAIAKALEAIRSQALSYPSLLRTGVPTMANPASCIEPVDPHDDLGNRLPPGWWTDAQAGIERADRTVGQRRGRLARAACAARRERDLAAAALVADHIPADFPHEVLSTRIVRSDGETAIILKDATGETVGWWQSPNGPLTLTHEGHRRNAVHALNSANVAIEMPEPEDRPLLPATMVPTWDRSIYYINLVEAAPSRIAVGIYQPEQVRLTVVAEPFLEPATHLLRRHGFCVEEHVMADQGGVFPFTNLSFDPAAWGAREHVPHLPVPHPFEHLRSVRKLTRQAGALLPDEIALVLAEALSEHDLFSPQWDRTSSAGVWPPSATPDLVARFRPVELPSRAAACWSRAREMSPAHAPMLTALLLADAAPEWWAKLTQGPGRPIETLRDLWPEPTVTMLRGRRGGSPVWSDSRARGERPGERVRVQVPFVPRWAYPHLDQVLGTATAVLEKFGSPTAEEVAAATDCRICGEDTAAVSVNLENILFTGGVSYCGFCCEQAREGLLQDFAIRPDRANAVVWAMRELSALMGGLSSRPLLEAPLRGPDIDRQLLLRMCLPLEGSWIKWLSQANLLTDGVRHSRGVITMARDGHLCRSLLERQIDDWFTAHRIEHEYEPAYPFHAEYNTTGLCADWKLPDGTWVEAAGMMAEPAYAEKIARKRALAVDLGLDLVIITEYDLPRLSCILRTTRGSTTVDLTKDSLSLSSRAHVLDGTLDGPAANASER